LANAIALACTARAVFILAEYTLAVCTFCLWTKVNQFFFVERGGDCSNVDNDACVVFDPFQRYSQLKCRVVQSRAHG